MRQLLEKYGSNSKTCKGVDGLHRGPTQEVRKNLSNGGADGIRTHDLLDAIEARSQLRHGPTELI